ncbi:hypothetical protein [Calidithermus timidus]|jgi:hypothetical protein|uniref:hypothetical protein n=1 Tax=Calidithermus timidus TaxID=307124 RepID=UPI0003A2E58A|nr:hypothetical protein [Calidithermus timidus]
MSDSRVRLPKLKERPAEGAEPGPVAAEEPGQPLGKGELSPLLREAVESQPLLQEPEPAEPTPGPSSPRPVTPSPEGVAAPTPQPTPSPAPTPETLGPAPQRPKKPNLLGAVVAGAVAVAGVGLFALLGRQAPQGQAAQPQTQPQTQTLSSPGAPLYGRRIIE